MLQDFVDQWEGPQFLWALDAFGASQVIAKFYEKNGYAAAAYDFVLDNHAFPH